MHFLTAVGLIFTKLDILGNNPTKVCELCRGSGEQKCTSSDPHANFDGALRCLDAGGDVAFVRHDTVATNRPGDLDVSAYSSIKTSWVLV